MLKRDLIDSVAENLDGFLKKDVSQAVDIILETIVLDPDQYISQKADP